mmetsp:Transcript_49104/g.106928  ORF Transcript_49104/g.106928 Transcript_49104/m.106928 type:complete len:212 (+) Transcript_49104:1004-1639(+)
MTPSNASTEMERGERRPVGSAPDESSASDWAAPHSASLGGATVSSPESDISLSLSKATGEDTCDSRDSWCPGLNSEPGPTASPSMATWHVNGSSDRLAETRCSIAGLGAVTTTSAFCGPTPCIFARGVLAANGRISQISSPGTGISKLCGCVGDVRAGPSEHDPITSTAHSSSVGRSLQRLFAGDPGRRRRCGLMALATRSSMAGARLHYF